MARRPYLCGECGEPMERVAARVPYPECGFDNVVLDRVPTWQCANGHQDLQIPGLDNLHHVLAHALVVKPNPLTGQEVQFLRKNLGYSGREFSRVLGASYVTLSRFENNHKDIPHRFDALVRLFCAQVLCEKDGRPLPKPLIPVLAALEDDATLPVHLCLDYVDLAGNGIAEPRFAWRQLVA